MSFPTTLYKFNGHFAQSALASGQDEFDALIADGWLESPEAVSPKPAEDSK